LAIVGIAIDSVTRSMRLITTSTKMIANIRQRTVLALPVSVRQRTVLALPMSVIGRLPIFYVPAGGESSEISPLVRTKSVDVYPS